MPLRFERPSELYMRELKAVAQSAAALRNHFPKINFMPNDFPQEQVKDFCNALVRLPQGTAEGSIAPLRAADEALNPIRQRFFHATLEDEKEPEFGFTREGDLDLRLVSLMAAVRSAIERYKAESGEVLDTDISPDLPANPAIEKPRQSAKDALKDAASQIDGAEKAFEQIEDASMRQSIDAEERLVKDAGTQVKSTEAVLASETPRPSVLGWLDEGLQSTEVALTKVLNANLGKAKKIGTATGNFASQLTEIWLPKISKSLKPVREYVHQIRSIILDGEESTDGDDTAADFSYVETYNRLLRGEAIPKSWIPFITQLDFSFDEPHHVPLEDQNQIVGESRLFASLHLLASLTNLRVLRLNSTNVVDLTPLVALNNLEELGLERTQIVDVLPLGALTSLEMLDLTETKVTNIAPLVSLSKLKVLHLDFTQVVDIAPIWKLNGLRELTLFDTKITNIDSLAALTDLRTLSISGSKVFDISSLAPLKNLRKLHMTQTLITDLAPLAFLSNLQELYLDDTLVENLKPLTSLAKLEVLSLNDTQVNDLSPLSGLINLEELHLERTKVFDVSSLANLVKLQYLSLDDTEVTSVEPLAAISGLESLWLKNTKVPDYTPLSHITKLRIRT
jgi:Leucine-rich repeat (LRR) protein